MSQVIVNRGKAGSVLNGRNGSTTGADSNDALFLDWTGLDYVYLPGVAGNNLSIPDEAALDITGDIDIRVQVALDDWTPATTMRLFGKVGAAGQRSYVLTLLTSGVLRMTWYADGTAGISKDSTAATGITDGAIKWVRATLDVDNGSTQNEVKFLLSDDGTTWTQLGSTVTTAAVTSIFASTAALEVGSFSGGADPVAGKFYRAQVFNGIDGTKVLDVDTSVLTSGAATTFTALTGQTVTINRSTSGRKTVSVVSPVWLFGTDDFIAVVNNDLLNFNETNDFTIVAVIRQWNTPANAGRIVTKAASDSAAGYTIRQVTTTFGRLLRLHDGTSFVASQSPTGSNGVLASIVSVVDRTAQTSVTSLNGVAGTSQSISAIGSPSNSLPLHIGTVSADSTNRSDMELIAVAIYRRALTATEITQITSYYQSRLS